MKAFDDIERMILEHINDINHSLKYDARLANKYEYQKAKSIALQALVELKNGKDGR